MLLKKIVLKLLSAMLFQNGVVFEMLIVAANSVVVKSV